MPNFMLLSTKNVEPCHTIIIVLQTKENSAVVSRLR